MQNNLRFLLLQIRNQDDPMRPQEIACFQRALGCDEQQIQVYDLLRGVPSKHQLDQADIVLIGGSGDYSVAEGGSWLDRALESMRELYEFSKPTFASCWGFQAISRALGGAVVTDLSRAEVGTHHVRLLPEGQQDPIFKAIGPNFLAQMGHQDIVDSLPAGATLLASTDRVDHQAYRLEGKPIYCTQFHPELRRVDLLARVNAYPHYVERIAGVSIKEFVDMCRETPEAATLLTRFVDWVTSG